MPRETEICRFAGVFQLCQFNLICICMGEIQRFTFIQLCMYTGETQLCKLMLICCSRTDESASSSNKTFRNDFLPPFLCFSLSSRCFLGEAHFRFRLQFRNKPFGRIFSVYRSLCFVGQLRFAVILSLPLKPRKEGGNDILSHYGRQTRAS